MKTKIIGHRGGVAGYPENTLAAFKRAVELKADGVEFDVQLTKDGEVVVIHDEFIDRTMDGSGLVKDHTFAELRSMSVGQYFSSDFKDQKLPTLREVLEIVKDLELINIELKNHLDYPNLEEKVLKLVNEFEIRDKVFISSFNHYSLEKIKKIQPAVKTGALMMAKIINPVDYAFKRGFDALHMQFLTIDQKLIKKAHFMGLKVCAYTVNYSESVVNLLENEIDMIITDDIEMVKKLRKNRKNI